MPGNQYEVESRGLAGNSPINMAYILGTNGSAITQATLTSINLTIYTQSGTTLTIVVAQAAVTISAAIFDTVQTDANWDSNRFATGYNFRHQATYTFPTAGTLYVMDYLFDPTSGSDFIRRFRYRTEEVDT